MLLQGEEQGFTFDVDVDVDEKDFDASHLEIFYKGVSVGTSRVFELNGWLFVGRVVIDQNYRHLGLGKSLVGETLKMAGANPNYDRVHCYTLNHLIPFYHRFDGSVISSPHELINWEFFLWSLSWAPTLN